MGAQGPLLVTMLETSGTNRTDPVCTALWAELSRQIHSLHLCFLIISLPLLVFRAHSFLVTVSLGFHPF